MGLSESDHAPLGGTHQLPSPSYAQCADRFKCVPLAPDTPLLPPSTMSAVRSISSSTHGENNKVLLTSRDVDIGAVLTAGKEIHLDPGEALRLR